MLAKKLWAVSGVLFGLSAILLVWSVFPNPATTISIPIPSATLAGLGLPGQFTLTWSETTRLGETTEVIFQLPAVEQELLPVIALAEADLELDGMEIHPGANLRQTVTSGKEITFRWLVTAKREGRLNGTLWFYWTTNINGEPLRLPVLARAVQSTVAAFLGLSVAAGRGVSLGLAAGGIGLLALRKRFR